MPNKIFTWDEVRYSIPHDHPLILLPTGEILTDDCKHTGFSPFATGTLAHKENVTIGFSDNLQNTATLLNAVLAIKVHVQPMDKNVPADVKGYENCPNCDRKLNHAHFKRCPNPDCNQLLNWTCQTVK